MNSTELIWQSAAQHLAAGEWRAASAAAEAGLRHAPDHGGLHEVAGVAAYEQEEFSTSLFHLESATTFTPLGVDSQLLLADLYLRFAQMGAARAVLEFLADGDRCPTPMLADLAKALGRAGRPDVALGVCQRLTAVRPSYHPAWFGVAYYLGQLGRPAGQLEFPLRKAFELAPQALPYRLNLAAVYADIGRLAEAYRLVSGVPVEVVGCRCQCRRFATACEAAGDNDRAVAFRRRADWLDGADRETVEFDAPWGDAHAG